MFRSLDLFQNKVRHFRIKLIIEAQIRKISVYINASENRKKIFFKLQRNNLAKKRETKEMCTLFNKKQTKIKRARSLKLFQNVVSRWNSTCHMLIRAHDLRSEIIEFCIKWDVDYFLLNNDEWSQIKYLIELLRLFCLFIKILNITRIFIINTIFKIYNRLFEHLKKTKSRLARKRMIWKRSLIDALIATKTKLIKYYNQIQNELNLLYDKAVLLHSIVDDTLFQIAEWKIEFEKTFWSEMYWNALKEMYYEYKQKSIQFEAQSKQFNSQSINQTLNDILDDDVIAQASFDENEFNVYRRQDMLYDIFF